MRIKPPAAAVSIVATALLALVCGPAAAAAAAPAAAASAAVRPPDAIVTKNVPAIAERDVEPLLPYENIRSASLADWHPTQRRLLITTRFAQAAQLHEVAAPGGDRAQLTFYGEPVLGGRYRPNDPRQIVFALNSGGAENYQLFLLDRTTGRSRRLSDGVHRYENPRWSHGGRLLAYVSNARNGRDFDLYVMDPAAAGGERRLAELAGSWEVLAWSPDDRRLLLEEFISINESYLYWVDVASGERHALTPKRGGPTVAYSGGRWSADGGSVYTTSDRDNEFLRLVRLDLATGLSTVLSGAVPWDVEAFDVSDDGTRIAFFTNEDGVSRLHLLEARTGGALPSPELPAGVASGLAFRPGSHEVGFGLSWARAALDVYSYDADNSRLERWTASEIGGLNAESFQVPQLVRFPTFDTVGRGSRRTIPAFVYRPPADRFPGRRPVFLSIHGGPEGQARPTFIGSSNYYLNELGVAIVVPNVRGSSGYGKSYLLLDNGEKREDSVRDIGALLDWIAQQPDLDPARVMVAGGSYGGYMSLASLTFYSDRLACGYDAVGISNFVTFLENTQEYRRDLRRVEYGDERDPKMRAFLTAISPAQNAAKIRRPLLVAAGVNDPRVPVTESNQIVDAVERNGVPVWYVVAKDEGHGFVKKANSDYLRDALIEFMKRYLLGGETAAPAATPGR
jgi:dipeptidyl aminopeptidase/acylaminoacyl peptidase